MSLLRALVPSWRFFGGIDSVPELQFRVSSGEGREFSDWKAALGPNAPRSLGALFFNPRGNLRLACLSLVERLTEEEELTTDSVSYRLVTHLVRYQIRELGAEIKTSARFQFRVISAGEEVMVSLEHSLC